MDEIILQKLQCPRCRTAPLVQNHGESELRCPSCQGDYPLVGHRFPDFLSLDDRRLLQEELAFWRAHYPGTTVYSDESPESYREWSELCQLTGQEEVLEIGCGSGALLSALPARLLVGLEPVESLLLPSKGFVGIIGNADRLPLKDKSFDVVYFKHSLHHIVPKQQAFAEASRLVKPGGKLIIIEPNAAHPYRRLTSRPNYPLRKYRIIVKFMSPVETFQHAEELIGWGTRSGLRLEKLLYRESSYVTLSFKQKLQKAYAALFRRLLPEKYLLPNYFLMFRKPA